VDAEITIAVVNQSSSIPARIVEISLDGCRVRTARHYPLTTPAGVEVLFRINGIAFRLAGILRWMNKENEAGVEFAVMAQRRMDALVELLAELEAEQAAKAAQAAREAAEREPTEAQAALAPIAEAECRAAANQLSNPNSAPPQAAEVITVRPLAGIPPAPTAAPRPNQGVLAPSQVATPLGVAVLRMPGGRLPAETVRPSVLHAKPLHELPPRAHVLHALKTEAKPAGEDKPQQERPARATGRERRAQARHSVDNHAIILLIDVAARVSGRIIDLSMSGCRIRTQERFPVGIYRRVETEFTCDGLPFRLGGVIQSLHDKFTVGIRFLDMSARKREQLAQLMEEMDEMRRNPPANPEPIEMEPAKVRDSGL
jgi:hypothetical protein